MPEKLADIGKIGPTDAQGNCYGGAGSAKAAVQQVQVRAMVPSHQPAPGIDLPHEAVRESRVNVSPGETGLWSPPNTFKRPVCRLLFALPSDGALRGADGSRHAGPPRIGGPTFVRYCSSNF